MKIYIFERFIEKLDKIINIFDKINKNFDKINKNFDKLVDISDRFEKEFKMTVGPNMELLVAEVAETKTVQASAVVAIEGVIVKLQALIDQVALSNEDEAKALELVAELHTATEPLAAAIVNIPA
jgi:hypothetical protein